LTTTASTIEPIDNRLAAGTVAAATSPLGSAQTDQGTPRTPNRIRSHLPATVIAQLHGTSENTESQEFFLRKYGFLG
jgi:hypothetical protein